MSQAGARAPQLGVVARLWALGAWRVDLRPLQLTLTPEWLALLGHQAHGRPRLLAVLRLLSRPMRRQLLQAFSTCMATGATMDTVVSARSFRGETLSLRVMADPVHDAGGAVAGAQGACQDITRQLALAQASERLTQRLRGMLESMTEGFCVLAPDGRVLYLNAAAERILRQPRQEVVGQQLRDCWPHTAATGLLREFEEVLAAGTPRVLQHFWEPLDLWLELRVHPADQGLAVHLRDVTQQRATEAELQAWRCHLEDLVAWRCHLEDLVAQRTRELRQTNDELTGFTLAVAHDLRAPLAAVSGFGRALAQRQPAPSEERAAHYLERMQVAADRMEAMLNGLVELARVGQAPLEPRQVNVSAVAADVVEILRASARGRLVQVHIQSGMQAWADPPLLRTVLDNLIGNAWKFTAARALAVIDVGCNQDGTFFVRDNGAGFEMAYAQHLFAPFRRLHAEGAFEGVGVGLATVRRVIQRHGGQVWAQSRPGEGTTLWFTLEEGPQTAPAVAPAA